jgi:2-dehydro-3-deoxygalactonokinase
MIGIDWGTTNLRAYRFRADGEVIERRDSAQGVARIADRGFETALLALIRDWLTAEGSTPSVVLSGMVGSRQGWLEAPYVPCPAGLPDIAAQRVRAPTAAFNGWIVPGLVTDTADGTQDVMRGEEVQIIGALREGESAHVIAPGTHSKWAVVEHGRIAGFRTYMTGELYALLVEHSILARSMKGHAHDDAAFVTGVRRSLGDPALLSQLFSVRTEALFNRIAPEALAAYLSGILIGAEIASALGTDPITQQKPVTLIASAKLSDKYARALEVAGVRDVRQIDGDDASARGLWRIGNVSLNGTR